jgi:hypothetical protein
LTPKEKVIEIFDKSQNLFGTGIPEMFEAMQWERDEILKLIEESIKELEPLTPKVEAFLANLGFAISEMGKL